MDILIWILAIHCFIVLYSLRKMKRMNVLILPALVKDMEGSGEIPMDLMNDINNVHSSIDEMYRVVCQVPVINLLWVWSMYSIIKNITKKILLIRTIKTIKDDINKMENEKNIKDIQDKLKEKDKNTNKE